MNVAISFSINHFCAIKQDKRIIVSSDNGIRPLDEIKGKYLKHIHKTIIM